MKVKLTLNEKYVEFDGEIDLSNKTVFIGPNLSGKSLILMCLENMSKRSYNVSVEKKSVNCKIEPSDENKDKNTENKTFDFAIFQDPYSIVYYIFEKFKQDLEYFEESEKEKGSLQSFLSNLHITIRSLDLLNDIKENIPDNYLFKAMKDVDDIVKEVSKKIEEIDKETGEKEKKYLLPLEIYPTRSGFSWEDYDGNKGEGVLELSTSFYSASVLRLIQYAYALSFKSKVLLLLDEPEAFSYPTLSYLLGYVTGKVKSENLYTVVVTHGWEFFKGVIDGEPQTKVYTITKENKKIKVDEWKKGLYVPGFSTASFLWG